MNCAVSAGKLKASSTQAREPMEPVVRTSINKDRTVAHVTWPTCIQKIIRNMSQMHMRSCSSNSCKCPPELR